MTLTLPQILSEWSDPHFYVDGFTIRCNCLDYPRAFCIIDTELVGFPAGRYQWEEIRAADPKFLENLKKKLVINHEEYVGPVPRKDS